MSAPPPTVGTARNLVVNPVPFDPTYYMASSNSVAPRTFTTNDAGRSAARCTRLTNAVYALYCGRSASVPAPVQAAEAGKTYTLLYTLRSNIDTTIQHHVGYGGATLQVTGLSVNHALTAGQELHVRRVVTIPGGTAWIGQQLFNKVQWAADAYPEGSWFEFSDVGWFEGDYVGPWFSGDTPDTEEVVVGEVAGFSATRVTHVYDWEGAPGASVSAVTVTQQRLGTYREELAYALSQVPDVTGHKYVTGATAPGTAFTRLERIEYPNPFGGVMRLNVVVLLPQDVATAEQWIETHLAALREEVGEHLVITSVEPQRLELPGVGILPALFINGHREEDQPWLHSEPAS